MKQTTVYIARHGQTEWNIEHRLQGHQDSALTELGIRQAQWLSDALASTPIDQIYTSSSERAVRTAEIIKGNRPLPIHLSDQLKEINLGIWEGREQQKLKQEYPEQFRQFWEEPETFAVEGGEQYREVELRALNQLNEIVARHAGQSILIVTHTVVIKLLMTRFANRSLKQLWDLPYIHPACLCKLVYSDTEPQPTIILHGDISHYQEAPQQG